jgi:uncharacterized protein YaiE (UPF0345 family)
MGILNSYRVSPSTGTMAAGLGAAAPIFSARWRTSSKFARLRSLDVMMLSLGTGFAAGSGLFELHKATGFSVPDTAGTGIIVAAAGTITVNSAGVETDSITIGSLTWTIDDTPAGDYQLATAGSATLLTTALLAKILGAAGYAAEAWTVAQSAATVLNIIAKSTGTTGNSIALTEVGSTFTNSNTTLTGGAATPAVGLHGGWVTTEFSDMRISSTATLTAGTRTALPTQPFASVLFGVTTATNTVHLPTTRIWSPEDATLVLRQDEGIVLLATVPATGTWRATVTPAWEEWEPF